MVCHPLYELFKAKKGINDGLILFSHNILGWEGMGKFLLFIIGELKVKKICYLELDLDSYVEGSKTKIPEIMGSISQLKINKNEFFNLFEKKQIKFSTIYEVGKY